MRVLMTLAFLAVALPVWAQEDGGEKAEDASPTLSGFVESFTKMDGYFPVYWDGATGTLWLEIPRFDTEFLYVNSLSHGLGSNDIGLDRGQLGDSRIVSFKRIGPKVLLEQPNYDYRAESNNAAERKAVREGFARSVLWGFTVEIEEEGRVLVDATDFFLRDAHGVVDSLRASNQGSYKLDGSRSALNLERTKNFPKNTEVDAILTFTGDNPGRWVRSVTPSPSAITINQHHSFIELPDGNYTPREFDPRAGAFGISFFDYATPIDEPLVKRYIARHRLEKRKPDEDVSDAVEPIIYYLDPGTPEPIRSALREGASWWNEAFAEIGYRDAFRVEMLPEDADPLDVRYNVIQWVHRSTRGWSYGSSVRDPRTGEIIKGHVTLGSLRVRQDYLIAQGLLSIFGEEDADTAPMREMALARLRQLSAHEVGHTLGFAHNFASSADGMASVMDYPHPMIALDDDGALGLSDAYDTGIGAWDKVAVAYAYQDFPKDGESEGLDAIIEDALDEGLHFISDQDARPAGGAHPIAHLWDNGPDAAEELTRMLKVRAAALERFGEATIPDGEAMASLEELLVPVYYAHRYQLEACVKLVAGVDYSYAMKGDGQTVTAFVPGAAQEAALAALLASIQPDVLTLPDSIRALIPPRPMGYPNHRELFEGRTGPVLDVITMAESAAATTLGFLLHPERAARLVQQHAIDASLPGFWEVLEALTEATWKAPQGAGLPGEVHRAVNHVVFVQILHLIRDEDALPQVRALAYRALETLLPDSAGIYEGDAQFQLLKELSDKALDDELPISMGSQPGLPPGSPIGNEALWCQMDSGDARISGFLLP